MISFAAEDGTPIRARRWEGGPDTVLLLQGRTEYIEKYESVAEDFMARGFSVVTFDWRGQGGSGRLLADPALGHVGRFEDYQQDLQAITPLLSGRVFLVAHSMGSLIALRWLMQGAPVQAAAFSAPMWGLPMAGLMRPVATLVAGGAGLRRHATAPVPGIKALPYVLDTGFAGNTLTSDQGTFSRLQAEARGMPDRMIGGPTLGWLNAALTEMRRIAPLSSPALPAITIVGQRERVVDTAAIRARMARWEGAALTILDGAEHEIMMERPDIRDTFIDAAEALFRR